MWGLEVECCAAITRYIAQQASHDREYSLYTALLVAIINQFNNIEEKKNSTSYLDNVQSHKYRK